MGTVEAKTVTGARHNDEAGKDSITKDKFFPSIFLSKHKVFCVTFYVKNSQPQQRLS